MQAPSPQTPLSQTVEQHCCALAQSWPSGVHAVPGVHLPSVQTPEQQSPSPAQGMSFAAQLPAPQTPLVHTCAQQSVAATQASPSSVQAGPPPAPLLDVLAPAPLVLLLDVLLVALLPPVAPPSRSG